MSNYIRRTKHPDTGVFEDASWIDDHFGKHNYGVRFPSKPDITWKADTWDWEFEDQLKRMFGMDPLSEITALQRQIREINKKIQEPVKKDNL